MNYKDANEIIENGNFDIDGIFHWNSNDNIPPKEIIEVLHVAGKLTDYDVVKHDEARDTQQSAFVAEYIEAQKNRSAEQIAEEAYEMRAAFGTGQEIVNVFTGKVTRT